jgi:hypothetical protein
MLLLKTPGLPLANFDESAFAAANRANTSTITGIPPLKTGNAQKERRV